MEVFDIDKKEINIKKTRHCQCVKVRALYIVDAILTREKSSKQMIESFK